MMKMDVRDFEKAYGFRPEATFVRFIELLIESSKGNRDEFSTLTDELFFFRPSKELWNAVGAPKDSECRYNGTPLELLPIGDHGCDGAHFGFIVMAPELPEYRVPIGVFNPMGFDCVESAGKDFRSALEGNVGSHLAFWQSDPEAREKQEKRFGPLMTTIIAEFNLSPTLAGLDMGWSTQDELEIEVPDGYSFLRTQDGLGVLCKAEQLSLSPPQCEEDFTLLIKSAKSSFKSKMYGDSLFCLRQAAWWFQTEEKERRAIAKEMVAVYEKLDRPLLARLAERRAKGEF